MLKSITYLCPDCNGSFKQLIDRSCEQPPRFCALCGFDTQSELQEGVSSPHLAKTIGKATDGMYRAMEEGAQFRADIARENFGLDAEQASALKMTNMKDNLREGDTSDMPVNNPVSQTMEAAPSGMFGFQGGAGLGYSGAVSQGPHPNAGAHAQQAVRAQHAKFTTGAGHAGATVSNLPALETSAPNYRRRVG